MANPPKQKGTQGENEVVRLLRSYGIPADRGANNRASCDIHVDDWDAPIEVKYRKRWDLFKWIRAIRKASVFQGRLHDEENPNWVLFCIHGDRRTEEGRGVGEVAVMDAEFAVSLLADYMERHGVKVS